MMKRKNIIPIKLLLAVLLMAIGLTAQAGPVSVKAKLDSAQLLMGNMTTLRLEVVKDANTPGNLELLLNAKDMPYVTVCGDSIELRTAYKADTTELGTNRIQINYEIPVQAFDSGFFRLPPFAYVNNLDTAFSNRVTLKVLPVMGLTADSEIAPDAGVVEPDGKSFFDMLPDWMIDFWWLIFIILALIGLMLWAILRKKKGMAILPKRPEPTPYEVAIWQLGQLKARRLWEQGMEKDYFTQLTEILRVYLEKRFGINAMEMTSQQILDKLEEDADTQTKKQYFRQILDVADFVKFAAVRPLPSDNVAAYDNAVRFVEETKPQPKPEVEENNEEGKEAEK